MIIWSAFFFVILNHDSTTYITYMYANAFIYYSESSRAVASVAVYRGNWEDFLSYPSCKNFSATSTCDRFGVSSTHLVPCQFLWQGT